MKELTAINESAKKNFGQDISILVARARNFGNDDNMVLVFGTNHTKAATAIAKVAGAGAKVATQLSRALSEFTEYSTVNW